MDQSIRIIIWAGERRGGGNQLEQGQRGITIFQSQLSIQVIKDP